MSNIFSLFQMQMCFSLRYNEAVLKYNFCNNVLQIDVSSFPCLFFFCVAHWIFKSLNPFFFFWSTISCKKCKSSLVTYYSKLLGCYFDTTFEYSAFNINGSYSVRSTLRLYYYEKWATFACRLSKQNESKIELKKFAQTFLIEEVYIFFLLFAQYLMIS